MTITTQQFEHIARLAYLDLDDVANQIDKCRATIENIEHLQTIDTTHVSPMHHPTSVTQYLRPDSNVTSPNIDDLARSAPSFIDNMYTVPLIIKGS